MTQNPNIDEIAKRLAHTFHPLAIYLFGSQAWGHARPESDVDMMVVVKNKEKKAGSWDMKPAKA